MWLFPSSVTGGLMPHGNCLNWQQDLLDLHLLADALLALAYFLIPFGLLNFANKHKDWEFRSVFVCCAGFIFATGTTHLIDIWTLWHPDYGLQSLVRTITAALATTIAILLCPLLPGTLKGPSRAVLTATNRRLNEEITRHRRTETSLRESAEHFRRFVEFSPLPVAMFDNNMCYLACSQHWLTYHRLPADILGHSHYEVFPELPERWKPAHRQALAGQAVKADEDRFERRDGTVDWLRWAVEPWFDDTGRIGGIMIYVEDISARKRLEEEREKFVQLIERSTDFIAIFAADGCPGYMNSAARRMLGSDTTETLQGPCPTQPAATPGALIPLLAGMIPKVRAHGVWQEEQQFRDPKTGTLLDLDCSLFSLTAPAREESAFGTVIRNITAQNRANALLAQRETEMRQLLDALPVLVAYIDKEERYRIVNKTYERWYARPCAEVEGLKIREVLGETRYAILQPNIDRALNGETVSFELAFPYPDGKERFIRPTYVPNLQADGSVAGIFVIIEDLTTMHETTEALRAGRDTTEKEVQYRTMELRLANAALKAEVSERRRTEKALTEMSADLAEAQRVAHIGSWRFDVTSKAVHWSDELYRIFEIDPQGFAGVYTAFRNRVHPEDLARVQAVDRKTQTEGTAFDIEYRILTGTGMIKTIREVGHARKDATGTITGLFGTAMDITERRAAEDARLADAVAQRQLLVRDVHHRIKNHLQGLVGLLERYEVLCPAAAEYFQQAAAQTHVIATIHGLQAQSGDEESRLVPIISAIVETAQRLTEVPIELRSAGHLGSLCLTEQSSVPVALVINELLLNAVKHGRYDAVHRQIEIHLDGTPEGLSCRIVNPGHLDLRTPPPVSTGLGLARLLLPREGASLYLESQTDFVEATLCLAPPVLV